MITTKSTSDPLKALLRLLEALDDEQLARSWETTEVRLRAEARRSFQAMLPMARASAKTAPEDLASARLIVARDEALADLAVLARDTATASRIRIRLVLGQNGNNPNDNKHRRDLAHLIGERTTTVLRMLYHCPHPDPVAVLPRARAALEPVLQWSANTRILYGQTPQLKIWATALGHATDTLTPTPAM
ncbi:hypothetical protein ABTZ03_26140 [Kitasatospora sp. NPDC096077]|uniref:hypothetical protein n=1 Tax=Kitasatospora sp. NPDC096077 TaxID=3155544 RepID=UPI003322B12B